MFLQGHIPQRNRLSPLPAIPRNLVNHSRCLNHDEDGAFIAFALRLSLLISLLLLMPMMVGLRLTCRAPLRLRT